jgi:hypothetical protein
LYCGTCEEVYDLPQKGIIKVVSYNLFNSIKIWFQLILSFPLCFFLSYMIFWYVVNCWNYCVFRYKAGGNGKYNRFELWFDAKD